MTDGLSAQQTSQNDVFFRRRSEDAQAVLESTPKQASSETPEITEINDIIRIAEAAQATKPGFVESLRSAPDEPPVAVETPSPLKEVPAAPQNQVSDVAQTEPKERDGFFRRLFGRHGKQ